jgi:hypothetical protein
MWKRITGLVGMTAMTAVMLAACATTTEKGTVGVECRQFLLVSSAEMDHSAITAYQNVLKDEGAKGAVNRDSKQAERVRRIATRLTPETGVFRKDAPAWKCCGPCSPRLPPAFG